MENWAPSCQSNGYNTSNGHHTPINRLSASSLANQDVKPKVGNIACAVCGDKSSGKHYGVYTCEGCKSFFKRSIRRNLAYSCRAFQSCPVDINHRNQCQFCRLKKCVKVGMRKDAVQKGRSPKSPLEGSVVDQLVGSHNANMQIPGTTSQGQNHVQTYTNLMLRSDISRYNHDPSQQNQTQHQQHRQQLTQQQQTPPHQQHQQQPSQQQQQQQPLQQQQPQPQSHQRQDQPQQQQQQHHQQQQQQQQQHQHQQPPPPPQPQPQQHPSISSFNLIQGNVLNGLNEISDSSVCEISARLLFNVVEWARNVPFFSALPTADQIALLKSCWSELYILNSSQHCSTYQINPRNLSRIPYNESHQDASILQDKRKKSIPEEPGILSNETSLKMFEDLVEKFKNLQTDDAEFSCLKALVLFNPDSPGIGNPSLIESLQEKAQAALEDYLRQHGSTNYANRFGKLLLRLPALSLIRPTTIETLFFSRLIGNQNIDNFVGSLLMCVGSNSNENSGYTNGGYVMDNHFGIGLDMNTSNINGHMNNINNVEFSLLDLPNTSSMNMNNINQLNNMNNMNNLPNGLHTNLQNRLVSNLQGHYSPSNVSSVQNIGMSTPFIPPTNVTNALINQNGMFMTSSANTELRHDAAKIVPKSESPQR